MKASVIIPSYNACERLYYNLISLNLQDCDKCMFEVIVVDNGSTDDTQEMLSVLDSNLDLKIIKLEDNQGRSKARNNGILKASGDIIIFSDSDMISDNTFIAQHIFEHKEANTVVCGTNWDKIYTYYYKGFKGRIEKNFLEQQRKTQRQINIKDLYDKQCLIQVDCIVNGSYKDYVFTQSIYEQSYKKTLDIYGSDMKGFNFPWSFFITNNCSVSKQNIIKAGMFDEKYEGWGCEDLDLGYRLYKNECRFIKRDIRSVHQEHPVISIEDGIRNIHMFTNKYDSLEVLLFYFARNSSIDNSILNEVVSDIYVLEKIPKALPILNIFKSILEIARDRVVNMPTNKDQLFHKSKKTKEYVNINKHSLEGLCNDIKQECGCEAFLSAFRVSLMHILKISLN
jgi:glycosyltransferase involved in cell wall biosynthesis